MTGAVSVRAHAKVNPALRVLGRRADGYHELETVLVALELADVVTVREAAGGGVTVRTTGPRASSDIVDGPDHLAARGAARALAVH
ncbi:MAG: 4-(cytidine 5'-diphospho)-2-C-methyl-D-erythritol kinase, partial [Planctomycetota bacterium]|nr:4-(cytidine 5'-diphospho)-2-C-methyl-D-erythritol kinase [Planctomycetota bacterium]